MLIRKKQVKCSDNSLLVVELIKSSISDLKMVVIEKDGVIGFLHKQKQETYEISTKNQIQQIPKKAFQKNQNPQVLTKYT